jgi:hypothetical protein
MTIEETIKWFNAIYEVHRDEQSPKNDFTCGIASEDELKEGSISQRQLLGWTLCDTLETASTLLNLLKTEGFNVIDEEKKERAVYMCRKENATP